MKHTKHVIDPDHEANQIHDSYISSAQDRNLSVAYGNKAKWFRLDSKLDKRWIYPAPNECLNASDVNYFRGMSRFDWRVGKENWTTSNVYDRTLRTSAAIPFTHKLNIDNWPSRTEALLNGEGGGLDAKGSNLKKMHQQALSSKLKPGIHFIRVANLAAGPVWIHVPADSLLDWDFKLVEGVGVVVTRASIESIQSSNHLVRTIYKVDGKDVVWKSYISLDRIDDKYIIYAPRKLKDMQFAWKLLEEGVEGSMEKVEGKYEKLNAVPIAPFYTDWEITMQSPPMFAEAADLQLRVDNANSHLNDYRLRVSASPVFVTVSDSDLDENEILTPVKSKGAMVELPANSSASWEAIDTNHAKEEAVRIADDENRIEFMCLSPLDTEYQGDTRVLETSVREGRSVTVLEALMLSDISSLDRLARFTAHLLSETVPSSAKITASRIKREGDKKDLIDRVWKWVSEGRVPLEIFFKIWKENSEDISDELWLELQPILDARVLLDKEIESKETEIRKGEVNVTGNVDLSD